MVLIRSVSRSDCGIGTSMSIVCRGFDIGTSISMFLDEVLPIPVPREPLGWVVSQRIVIPS